MKNFRKVLALVLVVATLFSFASVAGAKTLADYTDADKVTTENYEFAVDVLSGLEILNGYEDDTFKPTNTITRAEMAKMIAVLANAGDDNVDKLYAAACEFADVDKVNDWFASYVSYCAYTGIVAGRSATTFDPYGKVTGLETAKMLLVTMGMSAEEQGYVGASWKINVLRDAENFGLLDGFAAGYEVDEAITREEAAMMMLNALKAQVVVGVLSDNLVKVTNALYLDAAFISLKDAEHEGMKVLYGNVIVAPITLAEALYEGRLDVDFVVDCYGRPATQWTLVAKNGKTLFEGMLLVESMKATDYKGEMDLDEVLEDEIAAGYTAFVLRNGVPFEPFVMDEDTDFSDLEETLGKGVLVEVYSLDQGESTIGEDWFTGDLELDWDPEGTVAIIIIDTFIGKIGYIDLADNQFGIENTGWLLDSYVPQYDNDYGFTVDDLGKTVLYWVCDDEDGLHDIEIIEPTVAVVTDSTKIAGEVDNFVAGGKTYEYAYNFNNFMDEDTEKFGELDRGESRFGVKNDIYTDKYGYVMYHNVTDTTTTKYAVVKGDTWVSNEGGFVGGDWEFANNTAEFIYFQEDTTPEVVETDFDFNMAFVEKNEGDVTGDVLVKYDVDEDGALMGEGFTMEAAQLYKMGIALNAGKNNVDFLGDEMNHKVNKDTQIIVRVPNYTDAGVDFDYKYFDGIDEVDANYVAEEFQFFASDDNRYFTHIYMDARYAKETNRAFILSENSQRLHWSESEGLIGGNKYNAVVNGEKAIVVYDRLQLREEDYPILIKSEWVNVGMTIDGLPVWAKADEDEEAVLDFCSFCEIKIVGGVMTWVCDEDGCEHPEGDWTGIDGLLGADIDDETVIVIAWPTTSGYTFEKITEEDFYEYSKEYGWLQIKAYAQIDGEDCSELVLVVEDFEFDASDDDDDNDWIEGDDTIFEDWLGGAGE